MAEVLVKRWGVPTVMHEFAAWAEGMVEPLVDFDSLEDAQEWVSNNHALTGKRGIVLHWSDEFEWWQVVVS